jgi:hypothetical protein
MLIRLYIITFSVLAVTPPLKRVLLCKSRSHELQEPIHGVSNTTVVAFKKVVVLLRKEKTTSLCFIAL